MSYHDDDGDDVVVFDLYNIKRCSLLYTVGYFIASGFETKLVKLPMTWLRVNGTFQYHGFGMLNENNPILELDFFLKKKNSCT